MMGKEKYRNTDDYKKAKEVLLLFKEDFLKEDFSNLNGFDMTEIKKKKDILAKRKKGGIDYVGKIKNDPDMYFITQCIYIIVWGHLFDLRFSCMGSWGRTEGNRYPYRGDTMNSFNSVYGKNDTVLNEYLINEDCCLYEKIQEFRKLYHSIGNFIVIPNCGNVNSRRADSHIMQDYFDWFLMALYWYQNQEDEIEYAEFGKRLFPVFEENKEYKSIKFKDWVENFYLDLYIKDSRPKDTFMVDKNIRMKEYCGRTQRSGKGFYCKEEYKELAKNYCEISKKIIEQRGEKICEVLSKELC